MKVNFQCEDFKKAVDRALAVVPKRSSLAVLYSIKIATKDNCVIISATNTEAFIEISLEATVIESGVSFIQDDDIKKIYGLSGEVELSVSDEKVTIKNAKKKSSVANRDYAECEISFPEKSTEQVMSISGRELIDTLSKLSCFLDLDNTNRLMTGYYFDGQKKRIVALEGHYFAFRNMDGVFCKDAKSLVIPGFTYTHLKKIVGIKYNGDIKIYAGKKYVMFVGEDFTYWSRLIDGQYFDIDSLMKNNYDYKFSLDAKEFGGLAKEYKKAIGANRIPMYMLYDNSNSSIHTGVVSQGYMTADVVEGYDSRRSFGLSEDFLYGFNPEYIINTMALFDGEITCKGTNGTNTLGCKISPLIFESDAYTAFVLPVNLKTEEVQVFKSYIAA